jgi:protein Tex
MDYADRIASSLGVRPTQVAASIELMDAGNTLPFIARYRKEATGSLDEEQLRLVGEWLLKLRSLDERRQTILKSIQEQDKLTPELEQQIRSAETLTELEDLYQPYKPKRRTRASVARELGLQPLADLILGQARLEQTLEALAQPFLGEQVLSAAEAWAGARDIVAETISDHAEVRRITREKALQWGQLRCVKTEDGEDPRRVYELYYDFETGVDKLRPHQILAINRGEHEKVLAVRVMIADRDWQSAIASQFRSDPRSPLSDQLKLAAEDAAERLLLPAIERDVRRVLSEKAEAHAIQVFAANLRALLNQPPLSGHVVLGLDPGFRTGCKVAVVDATGKVLATETIYPHEPQKRWQEAKKELATLVRKHSVSLITIGNGTASRETEQLAAELIQEIRQEQPETGLQYLIVNEAGASVYSASSLARAELPGIDVSLRGAVSIARRAQDPLAELVKIDPKSIGVGLYQHDIDQKQLGEGLHGVVESAVNRVGVDVNTASPALLTYVAGIGPKLAERIVAYRDEKGVFKNRVMIRDVPGMGPKSFEQSAGFLRVREGSNPLDASAIHPESYPVAEKVLALAEVGLDAPPAARQELLDELLTVWEIDQLALELGTGVPTLTDILEQLVRPGRDPRQDVPAPILRSDVLKMEDLVPGMSLKGTVRNVVDFGAFVDIGVKQDGLLHRSQMPREASLQVGDIIDVRIERVDAERGRIALSWSRS